MDVFVLTGVLYCLFFGSGLAVSHDPNPQCQWEGYMLPLPGNPCKFLQCRTTKASYTANGVVPPLYTQEHKCPPGTFVPDNYKGGSETPCAAIGQQCSGQYAKPINPEDAKRFVLKKLITQNYLMHASGYRAGADYQYGGGDTTGYRHIGNTGQSSYLAPKPHGVYYPPAVPNRGAYINGGQVSPSKWYLRRGDSSSEDDSSEIYGEHKHKFHHHFAPAYYHGGPHRHGHYGHHQPALHHPIAYSHSLYFFKDIPDETTTSTSTTTTGSTPSSSTMSSTTPTGSTTPTTPTSTTPTEMTTPSTTLTTTTPTVGTSTTMTTTPSTTLSSTVSTTTVTPLSTTTPTGPTSTTMDAAWTSSTVDPAWTTNKPDPAWQQQTWKPNSFGQGGSVVVSFGKTPQRLLMQMFAMLQAKMGKSAKSGGSALPAFSAEPTNSPSPPTFLPMQASKLKPWMRDVNSQNSRLSKLYFQMMNAKNNDN